MGQLWSDEEFRERFLVQLRNSYSRGLRLRGQDQVNFAKAIQRLYCAAAAYCLLLLLDNEWYARHGIGYVLRTIQDESILVPGPQILNSPACLIRSTLAFSILRFLSYPPTYETVDSICNHLVICSSGQKHQDWKFLCVLSFVVSNLPVLDMLDSRSLISLQKAYTGDAEHAAEMLRGAFGVLVEQDFGNRLDLDQILINMLQYVNQMVTGDRILMGRKFTLLELCEPVLQSSRVPEAARQIIRKIRLDLAQIWERECDVWAAKENIPTHLYDMLHHYFPKVRTTYQADLAYDESVTALGTFGPPIRKLFSYYPWNWEERTIIREKRKEFRNMFNEFVVEVDALSRRDQNHARRVRDPDERWCHWHEQSASIRDLYSLSPDPPDSDWEDNVWFRFR